MITCAAPVKGAEGARFASTLTVQELSAAPAEVRERLAAVPEAHIEMLQLDAEAKELAEAYVAALRAL